MSLLTMTNNVALESGLEETGTVLGGDIFYRQIARFLARTAEKLISTHNWRAFKVTATFQGDDLTTLFDLPIGFEGLPPNTVIWEYGRPFFPLTQVSDQDMIQVKSVPYQRPWPVWRLVGDQIEFWPAPRLGGIFNFGYQTDQWVESEDGTETRSAFLLDTDKVLLPERILELGAIWRFKSAKGFEYAEAFREFELERAKAEQADSGRPNVLMSAAPNTRRVRLTNAYTVNA